MYNDLVAIENGTSDKDRNEVIQVYVLVYRSITNLKVLMSVMIFLGLGYISFDSG